MDSSELELIELVKSHTRKNPSFLRLIIESAVAGVDNRIKEEMARAADMEVLAAAALALFATKTEIGEDNIERIESLCAAKLEKNEKNLRLKWGIQT